MSPDDIVVAIVALNGGELVGRTRLQKAAFLLEEIGMNSGLEFDYHRYGPFSADLAAGWDEAYAEGRLKLSERLGSHEVPYTIFSANMTPPARLGDLDADKARDLLSTLQRYSDVVVELAATIVYLRQHGFHETALDEVKVRKPLKATDDRLKKATDLISCLNLTD